VKLGVPIPEDIWGPLPCGALKAGGAEILLVPNGSPFRRTSDDERLDVARARVAESGLPMVYVNQVGGQDELVFDLGRARRDGAAGRRPTRKRPRGPEDLPPWCWVCAPKCKSGFGRTARPPGGIDSAISLVVARDALGAKRGLHAALALHQPREPEWPVFARLDDIAIAPAVGVFDEMLKPRFEGRPDINENIRLASAALP
jgi:NAD+ synthase